MNHALPYRAILDSLVEEVVFCDTDHVIRYMNPAAIEHYEEGEDLLGTSIFDCHNDESNEVIREVFTEMLSGLEEQLITDKPKHKIYMRSVRSPAGELLGYYERYVRPSTKAD